MAFVPFVETDQPTMANFNEKFLSAIAEGKEQAVAEATKIASGSYVGTGTYGNANRNALTFNFDPKFVMIVYGNGGDTSLAGGYGAAPFFWAPGVVQIIPGYKSNTETATNARIYVTSINKTLSWYNTVSAASQFNASGGTYYYIAIG